MSYTKNTWANGDKITAEKLNAMENGIYNADAGAASAASAAEANAPVHVPFAVTAGEGSATGTTTATFADVAAAVAAGKNVIADVTINDGIEIFAPCTFKVPVTTPTSLLFGAVAYVDLGSGTAKSTLFQVSFSSSGTVGVITDELT